MKFGDLNLFEVSRQAQTKQAQIATRPKPRRKGDIVEMLYKYFDVKKERVEADFNPEWLAVVQRIVAETIKKYKAKYPRSKVWVKVNPQTTANDIVRDYLYKKSHPGEWDPEVLEPYEQDEWGDYADYEEAMADYEEEHNLEVADYEKQPFRLQMGSLSKQWKGNWPAKVFMQMVDEIEEKIEKGKRNMPQPMIPSHTQLKYVPKEDLAIIKDADRGWGSDKQYIESISVVIDNKGQLISYEDGDEEFWDDDDDAPEEIYGIDTSKFHIYKRHN